MTKVELLRKIDSFVNTCYMLMQNSAAKFAQENFTKLVNQNWDDTKSDEENTNEVNRMLEMNKMLNENMGNNFVAQVIDTFTKFVKL